MFFFTIVLTCTNNQNLFKPDGKSAYVIKTFVADTTGIGPATPLDSLHIALTKEIAITAGQPITFFAFITGDTSKISALWNFGDRTVSKGTIAEHAYNDSGVYNAFFTITDKTDTGFLISDTIQVHVNDVVGTDIKGYAYFKGESEYDSVRVQFTLTSSKTPMVPIYTRKDGLYETSGFPSGTYSVTYSDAKYDAFKPLIIPEVVISAGMLTVLPTVTLESIPKTLTILSIDSTTNSISVHYSKSAEPDFAEYRIYRSTDSTVDTTDSLWASSKEKDTVTLSSSDENYHFVNFYYRVYQKDTDGIWSKGSNVVRARIKSSPPGTPVITYPVKDGDTVWPEEILRWHSSYINGSAVKYKVLINFNNTGYLQFATALTDTFVRLTGYDSLSLKYKIIAYDALGDSSAWSNEKTAIISSSKLVTDIDGNIYHTVKIGAQLWTMENLKTTRYNDGAAIPLVTDSSAWTNLTTPGRCWYNNDSGSYANPYGALYNWYTINTGKLAPAGWHVPSDSEWTVLSTYLGDGAGGKLKEVGTTHWQSCNTDATNETGFSGLPGGWRYSGTFLYIGIYGYWWSSTVNGVSFARSRSLICAEDTFMEGIDNMPSGESIRLLRD